MCTAATYQTKDFYFGRNLDYEFGYGETVTFTPRRYPFQLNGLGVLDQHYAIWAWPACRITIPCITMPSTKRAMHCRAELCGQRLVLQR